MYVEEITGKQHYGDLKFSSGNIQINNKVVSSGNFIVNMNSLTVEDLSGGGKKRRRKSRRKSRKSKRKSRKGKKKRKTRRKKRSRRRRR